MKFATFKVNDKTTYGQIIDVEKKIYVSDIGLEQGYDLKHWIEKDAIEELKKIAGQTKVIYAEDEVLFLPPILTGEKIMCIGVNYANRNAEYKDHSDLPKYPSLFIRYIRSFVGHRSNLVRPPESYQLDYEGEIVMIIGKEGRRIKRKNALQHLAGLTLMNEGTLRDWVRHAKFNVTQGKNFERSGSIGPWMVTADEISNVDDISIETTVNGEVRQKDNTSNLMFPFDYIISYLSTFMTLKPGDMIATGTPNGAGARLDPPQYLKPGDVIKVKSEEIGVLINGVEDEKI